MLVVGPHFGGRDEPVIERLAIVALEVDNLAANMMAAVASAVLLSLVAERELENARLEGQLSAVTAIVPCATATI